MHFILRGLFRFFLVMCNLGFVVLGIGVFVLEVLNLNENDDLLRPFKNGVLTLPIIIFPIAVITTVISAIGCFGAIANSFTAMKIFGLSLFALVVFDCCIALAVTIFTDFFVKTLEEFFVNSLEIKGANDLIMWNFIQSQLECCGYDNVNDWGESVLPASCCTKRVLRKVRECTEAVQHNVLCHKSIARFLKNDGFYPFFLVGCIEMVKCFAILLSSWYVYEVSLAIGEKEEKTAVKTGNTNAPEELKVEKLD